MKTFTPVLTLTRAAIAASLTIGAVAALANQAAAATLRVTIDNLAPDNGTFLTPVWVGFHDGSFDIYDRDASLDLFPGSEALVEDGNTEPLSERFAATVPSGVQGTLTGPTIPPVGPGESTSFTFDVETSNQYFSYASMVIPSNDAFIANGNPLAHQVFSDDGSFAAVDFIVAGSQVLDGGTEVNDEAEFSTAFLGQAAPNTGTDENDVVTSHPGFIPDGRILTTTDFNGLNFTGADFTAAGFNVARIRVEAVDEAEAVPEPGLLLGLLTLGGSLAALSRKRLPIG
ncbi:MAG: PEP-CTERM sorting domain-containing protein [Leptolyngbya sp. SIO4C1]|nr:PEP-CTERM sorting domain-containing protein [Leptolyngbya sp. SIO4C1]